MRYTPPSPVPRTRSAFHMGQLAYLGLLHQMGAERMPTRREIRDEARRNRRRGKGWTKAR